MLRSLATRDGRIAVKDGFRYGAMNPSRWSKLAALKRECRTVELGVDSFSRGCDIWPFYLIDQGTGIMTCHERQLNLLSTSSG